MIWLCVVPFRLARLILLVQWDQPYSKARVRNLAADAARQACQCTNTDRIDSTINNNDGHLTELFARMFAFINHLQ